MARALSAYSGDPQRARSSQDRIFEEEGFDKLLDKFNSSSVAFAYFSLQALNDNAIPTPETLPPHSIRYGKYAMLFAVAQTAHQATEPTNIKSIAYKAMEKIINKWEAFEAETERKATNTKYHTKGSFNFDGYYKGITITDDIKNFSWI